MFERLINLSKTNSFFIFGARGTGKSTLLRNRLDPSKSHFIDLLDPAQDDRLSRRPQELSEEIDLLSPAIEWIVIDEIQKQPKLLDIVHKKIETPGFARKFVLTGSSARKLKRGSANLLAGRAFVYALFPLTSSELGDRFDLASALEWGTLPKIYQLEERGDREAFLRSYALTYLKEEIQLEQIVRKLEPFRQFLEVAAQSNGSIINYANIARDVKVDTKTVQSYFQILEDTLLGFFLEPFHLSLRKRQSSNPKFYLFDCGVKRALERTLTQNLLPQTYAFGKAFEHWVMIEIYRANLYKNKDYRLSYLRTKDDAEIDLILERPGLPTALIEIKSSTQVDERDVATLERFRKDLKNSETFCLSLDPTSKKIANTKAFHWRTGITELGL